jgi:hypothetical protein
MGRKKELIDKKAKKRIEGCCHFCGVDDYALLHCHRILPGEEGGRYTDGNVVVVCSNCHNRVHDGQIVIERWYNTTGGKKVLHFWENEEEKWK